MKETPVVVKKNKVEPEKKEPKDEIKVTVNGVEYVTSTKKEKSKKKKESGEEKKKGEEKEDRIIKGFINFVNKNSVIGIAIGLVIGTQIQKFIGTFVDSLITPFLNIFIEKVSSSDSMSFNLWGQDFKYGDFVSGFLELIIVMFVIYFIVKVILKRGDLIDEQTKIKPKSTINIGDSNPV